MRCMPFEACSRHRAVALFGGRQAHDERLPRWLPRYWTPVSWKTVEFFDGRSTVFVISWSCWVAPGLHLVGSKRECCWSTQ